MKTHPIALNSFFLAIPLMWVFLPFSIAEEPHHMPIESIAKDPLAVKETQVISESDASELTTLILSKETGSAFEASFLDLMSQHHHVGIKMAGLASSQTENTALKALAAAFVQTQGKDADQMEKWLKEWHSQSPRTQKIPEEISKRMAKTIEDLGKSKGPEFDQKFANAMIQHNRQGISLAALAEERAIHEELKTAAAKMLKQQQADNQALELIAK